MELEQARKRAAELRAVIEKNNRLYYDQDAPELEDYEYDQLTRELKPNSRSLSRRTAPPNMWAAPPAASSARWPTLLKWKACRTLSRWMNCASLTSACGKQALRRNMW